jgi:hypothetical protein
MPTLYGAWQGTGSGKARIRVEYTKTYSADRTEAIFDGTVYIEADGSVSDSTNSWDVNSKDGHFTGTNLSISIPSGGGKKAIKNFAFTDDASNSTLTASVSSIEYYGTTISGSFDMDNGALAPYLNSSGYTAGSITSNSAVISSISGNGNGSGLANVQVEVNTAQSDAGAAYYSPGSYTTAVTLTSLYRATTYWYRVRVQNSGYGWGAWGTWKSFTTLPTYPGQPWAGWSIVNIEQTAASVTGLSVDDSGSAIDTWLARVNTAPQETSGFTDFTVGGASTSIPITGLIPGTLYYVKLWAHNAYGWNADPVWKSFTTLPGVSVNVGGVWKNATPWVNVNGIWKPAVRYVNVGGVWKQ